MVQAKDLERRVGQMFIIGIEDSEPSRDIREHMENLHPGGVILFERNYRSPEQLTELIAFLQGINPEVPLFMTVDQEGGRVNRLKKPFTQFPSAAELGKLGSDIYAYKVGQAVGRELAAVGINMNLAPVLDVNTNPLNPVIGDRSFGADPRLVATLGTAYMHGLQSQGVAAVGKHFPGHGDTSLDSHAVLPRVEASWGRLYNVELRPFWRAAKEQVGAIMTAHVVYPALDSKLPATLSKKIVTGLLNHRIKFTGPVISDDLKMGAIATSYSLEEACLAAVKAGVDALLICQGRSDQQKAFAALLEAFARKSLGEELLYKALGRVLALKGRILGWQKNREPLQVDKDMGSEANQTLLAELTREIEKAKLAFSEKTRPGYFS